MNILNNRNKRISIFKAVALCLIAAVSFTLVSCDDDMDIRYFQFEGEGSLKMDNGITFLPNDRYLLENEKFRLYYTAEGDEAHNFIVVVEDNFKNSYELEFDFNNRNIKDDGFAAIPIGSFKRV